MKTCTCDLCKDVMDPESGAEFTIPSVGVYNFCLDCIKIVRRAVCRKCEGTGKFQERDDEASDATATCGENRTQYRTVNCQECR